MENLCIWGRVGAGRAGAEVRKERREEMSIRKLCINFSKQTIRFFKLFELSTI